MSRRCWNDKGTIVIHLAHIVVKKCDTWFLGFFSPACEQYFISVLYMLHMCSCEQVLDIMFFLKVSILYYPVIHLAHSCEWVFRHVFSQSSHNIWLSCYTSCTWSCPATRKIQLLRTFFYNRINLGLHPSLYINTLSTHCHLHLMLLSFLSFFSSTSRLKTEFRKQQQIHHGSSIFLCSCRCTGPHLGRITYKSCCCCCTKCSFVHCWCNLGHEAVFLTCHHCGALCDLWSQLVEVDCISLFKLW